MNESEQYLPLRPRSSGRKRRNALRGWWIAASCVMMLGAIVASVALLGTGNARPSRQERVKGAPPDSTHASVGPPQAHVKEDPPAAAEVVVEDPTGELLWSSPTHGGPISLAYVPAGAQCLVHLRPAQLASHPEGERILTALGPWGAATMARGEELLASDLREVQSLLITVVVTSRGTLDACLRAHLAKPWRAEELASRFPNSQPKEHAGVTYREQGDRAWFLAPMSEGKSDGDDAWLVSAPVELVGELIDAGVEAPPLIRDVERLADRSDVDRLATAIVSPKFLRSGGSDLLTAEAGPLRDAIEALAEHDATALLLSAHWDEDFFLELQATPALSVPPRRLAARLNDRIAAAPAEIEEQIAAARVAPYGRQVIARFPAMLRALTRYARTAESEGCAVVRAYLPPMAGHNLLMAAELLLTQTSAPNDQPAVDPAQAPTSTEERLAAVTSLSFPKDTLERALELLAEDLGVEIAIDGRALQLEGITKNQSLALDLRDQPGQEILTQILLRANPDRTATGPADARQELVYTLAPGESDAAARIIVTTRAAADRQGQPLPDAFRLKLP